MAIITDADFRKALKGGLDGVYFFFGAEDYLKLHALRSAREAVCPDPSLEFFNDIKIDGSEFDPSSLVNALPTLPVMAEKKLIEITSLDLGTMKKAELDALLACLSEAADYDFNVIILSAVADGIDEGYLPKYPSPMLKKIMQHATPVHFPRSSPAQLSRWVQKHFAHNGIEADPALCSDLIDFCGKDMFVLSNETDKLSWFLLSHGRTRLLRGDMENVSIPDTGYDAFAFANAITARRRADALTVLAEMKRRRIEPTLIMGEIIKTFCDMLNIRLLADDGLSPRDIGEKLGKMHEYKVKLILRDTPSAERVRELLLLCERTDAALKLSAQGYMPIEQLICSI